MCAWNASQLSPNVVCAAVAWSAQVTFTVVATAVTALRRAVAVVADATVVAVVPATKARYSNKPVTGLLFSYQAGSNFSHPAEPIRQRPYLPDLFNDGDSRPSSKAGASHP